MSNARLMTWQRATALVPLALLSAGWTASLAVPTTASAADSGRLPDGTALPSEAIEAPASVSQPGVIAPGVPRGAAGAVVASASTHGIPDAALIAYRRAAQVIDSADQGCHLDWTLIAAIGRVESDHGRYGNNTLTDQGVSSPGIYGIPLDGSNGTAAISDTDAGELDADPVFDRAVGPMQFIPSTWSVVGVDGDGDGVRNPQDVDDAALASAVYLCSGDEDLATAAGRRTAVYRYNHSEQYVDLVLSIMAAYAAGEFSSVPNGSAAPATFTPSAAGGPDKADRPGRRGGGDDGDGDSPVAGPGPGDDNDPTPAPDPSGGPSGSPGDGGSPGGGPGDKPDDEASPPGPGPKPSQEPAPLPPLPSVTAPVVPTLDNPDEATAFCNGQLAGLLGGLPPLVSADSVVQGCAHRVVGMTEEQAAATIPDTLAGVLGWLGL